MNILLKILNEIVLVTMEMAPYLLFGFLMAGILSTVISKDFVGAHLGGRSWLASLKAALIGVPMPICSCGVIPLAASLRKHGAGKGATASFLASTPQTGADSLMVTYALLGWVFAVFRALVAFLTGIICGITVEAVSDHEKPDEYEREETKANHNESRIAQALRYGFLVLPRNISRAMVTGIIISGIISGIIPENFFADRLGSSPWAMLIMLVIGIPIYVCSSASVPIALAFIKAGLSPGAALVFLITGPATNAATLTTLWQIIGKKQLLVFMTMLSICALIAGFFMNFFTPVLGVEQQICHEPSHFGFIDIISAVLLIIVFLKGLMPEKKLINDLKIL